MAVLKEKEEERGRGGLLVHRQERKRQMSGLYCFSISLEKFAFIFSSLSLLQHLGLSIKISLDTQIPQQKTKPKKLPQENYTYTHTQTPRETQGIEPAGVCDTFSLYLVIRTLLVRSTRFSIIHEVALGHI